MRLYEAAPHPFALWLEPEQRESPYHLGLLVFGRGLDYLPYFVHAFEQAGRHGIGSQRQVFELAEVWQASRPDGEYWSQIYEAGGSLKKDVPAPLPVPPVPETIKVVLHTPLRLQRDKHLVTPSTFRFADHMGSVTRRISMLSYFHTANPLEADFVQLKEIAQSIEVINPRLRWFEWTRYSSRQQSSMEMGGMVGEYSIRASQMASLWPLLWLGQWTLAGKGVAMGMGRYSLVPADENNDSAAAVTSSVSQREVD